MDNIFGRDSFGTILSRFGINIPKSVEEDQLPDLEVTYIEMPQKIIEGFTTIVLKTNREITIEENERFNLILNSQKDGEYVYVVEVRKIGFGDAKANFSVFDSQMNEQQLSIDIERVETFSFLGETYVEPWPDTKYVVDGNNLLANVNKNNRLLNTYAPDDLVNIRDLYPNIFLNKIGFELRAEAANQLNIMLTDMRNEIGKNVVVASAYRSYNEQVRIYTGYVLNGSFTRAEVDQFSARPGYSEHQLGTVVDFTNEESNFELTENFDTTQAGIWLLENAWKYGYIQTYPKGSEEKTGYNYEAWHYRYIGEENAANLKESDLFFVDWILKNL